MPGRERRIDAADHRLARGLASLGGELREARLASGLSLQRVGELVGRSRTHVARVERGLLGATRVADLNRIAAVVGLDLSLRLYPSGPPIRDAAHVALLECIRSELAVTLQWRTEVPLGISGDARAFDAVITGAGPPIAVEAETRIRDLQALERRIALKLRDGSVGRVILLVRQSRANRAVLAAAPSSFWAAYPMPAARVLRALRAGGDPGGSGVVLR